MVIDINKPDLTVKGEIKFEKFTPLEYDAMGPFKALPFMECSHFIVSMNHKVSGKITLNGKVYNFDGGHGYIEGDKGISFPKKYFWSQCIEGETSIFASCAIVPYFGIKFKGTICIVHIKGKEYRLATYLGAKVKSFNDKTLVVTQGQLKLKIEVLDDKNNQPLLAPANGKMSRKILESLKRKIRYELTMDSQLLLDITSEHASYEYSDMS